MVCVADLVDACSLIWISGDGGKNSIMVRTSFPRIVFIPICSNYEGCTDVYSETRYAVCYCFAGEFRRMGATFLKEILQPCA